MQDQFVLNGFDPGADRNLYRDAAAGNKADAVREFTYRGDFDFIAQARAKRMGR